MATGDSVDVGLARVHRPAGHVLRHARGRRRRPLASPPRPGSEPREHPRHRRGHQQRPGQRGARPTPRWPSSTTATRCPTRRRPAWSSSTPTVLARRGPRAGRAGRWPRPGRSTASASPTSGRRPSCGTGPPASRWGRRWAGRTCAPSASAWCTRATGLRFAPNQSATKLAWLLDTYDPDRSRDLCFGTPDTWIAWHAVAAARLHVTDLSNAAVTGLVDLDGGTAGTTPCWTELRIPAVDAAHHRRLVGRCWARPPRWPARRPSPASSATSRRRCWARAWSVPGPAKITFGTGGMLDVVVGPERPGVRHPGRGRHLPHRGLAPRRRSHLGPRGDHVVGRHQRRVAARRPAASWPPAPSPTTWPPQCETTDGVVYVPALLGLGTPQWDYGARGTLLGLTRGAGRPQVVRAVLEGVAQRGADLVDAVEAGRPARRSTRCASTAA